MARGGYHQRHPSSNVTKEEWAGLTTCEVLLVPRNVIEPEIINVRRQRIYLPPFLWWKESVSIWNKEHQGNQDR